MSTAFDVLDSVASIFRLAHLTKVGSHVMFGDARWSFGSWPGPVDYRYR